MDIRLMANKPSSDSAAVAAQIIGKRDSLVARHADLMRQRREIVSMLRQAERELDDCRATARFFDLKIEFPSEEDLRLTGARRLNAVDVERAKVIYHQATHPGRNEMSEERAAFSERELSAPHPLVVSAEPPPLREFLISQLQLIGPAGGRAAGLRALYEQTFSKKIHEKTVGMTLYRLLKQGDVHRDGHTWYFGKGNAEDFGTKSVEAVTE